MTNARLLSKALEATGWYVCVSDIHRKKGEHVYKGPNEVAWGKDDETSADYNAGLPVVAFHFSEEFKKDYGHVKQESVSNLLRGKQYIIPSKAPPSPSLAAHLDTPTQLTPPIDYPLPPKEDKTEILRVVIRESMSLDLLDRLITDICATTQQLMDSDPIDLAAFQPGATSHFDKEHTSQGLKAGEKHKAKRPMSKGVHRTVC